MKRTSSSSKAWPKNSWIGKQVSRLLRRAADWFCPQQPIAIDFGAALTATERELYRSIGSELAASNPGRDAGKCDRIFGQHYTYRLLKPCNEIGLSSRAALAGDALIKSVIAQEKKLGAEIHKGALFHDTGAAHFLCGNVDKYEYLLAMAAEEDAKSSGGSRTNLNLQQSPMTGQTITERMQCACDLLNGVIAGHGAHYTFLTGLPPIHAGQLDAWRQQLHPLEQFEFLRIIHDIHQFLGIDYAEYEPVKDNPFVMLRLAKALSHLAQWAESCLTACQLPPISGTLSKKLMTDSDFNTVKSTAPTPDDFAGNDPYKRGGTALVNGELDSLLRDLAVATSAQEGQWRALRIFYIVRNATAHSIDSSLWLYTDRAFLLKLIQVVFVSVFAVCQLKGKPMPH